MGAQQSVNLSCLVEKAAGEYTSSSSGGVVRGKVILKVEGQPLTSFEGVTLTLAGVEYMLVDNILVPNSIGNKIKMKQSISNFYKQFDKCTVPKGVHEFPFELTLPIVEGGSIDDVSIPSLTHSRSSSLSSTTLEYPPPSSSVLDLSRSSTASYYSTISSSSSITSTTSTISRQIKYKIRASLQRKKNVGITVDTDYWCDAQYIISSSQ